MFIHSTAEVSKDAHIGEGTKVWHQAQVRENVRIGKNCIIGKGVYIDFGVSVGDNTKVQNGVFIYHGAAIEEGVFLGPRVVLTNDKLPRAINSDGFLKTDDDWIEGKILVKKGASIGAGSVILPNVEIGVFALIGAGSVVTKSIPDYGLAFGNPARLVGYVCKCGNKLNVKDNHLQCLYCKKLLIT